MLVFGIVLNANSANAQQKFKPFKTDLSWGFVMPDGPGTRAGLLVAAEPKYAVMQSLAVGLRAEGSFGVRDYTVNDGERQYDSDLKRALSILGTADYFFTRNTAFRPFIGGGAGLYFTRTEVTNAMEEKLAEAKSTVLGAMARVGFETWHFRFGLEYNFVPKTQIPDHYYPGTTIASKNGYLGTKAGFFIGGGRIKKKRHRWSPSE
ncbi:MAG: outer membrane beta-barrel protein [Flavitalea sp.]